jgi:hypothetical protein
MSVGQMFFDLKAVTYGACSLNHEISDSIYSNQPNLHLKKGILKGKYHCTVDLLFDWFGISCMTTDNFCFYLQNRLIQTSQTGGQWYSDTSPFSIPCLKCHVALVLTLKPTREKQNILVAPAIFLFFSPILKNFEKHSFLAFIHFNINISNNNYPEACTVKI